MSEEHGKEIWNEAYKETIGEETRKFLHLSINAKLVVSNDWVIHKISTMNHEYNNSQHTLTDIEVSYVGFDRSGHKYEADRMVMKISDVWFRNKSIIEQ